MSESRKALQDVARILREADWDSADAPKPENGNGEPPELRRHVLKIHFAEGEEARANQYAQELHRFLLQAAPQLTVSRQREDPLAQDAGSALTVTIPDSSAVLALAQGINAWLERRTGSSVIFEAQGKELVINNLTSHPAANLVEKIAGLLGTTPPIKG